MLSCSCLHSEAYSNIVIIMRLILLWSIFVLTPVYLLNKYVMPSLEAMADFYSKVVLNVAKYLNHDASRYFELFDTHYGQKR